VELIEGEIIDMAPIGSRHAAAVNLLAKRLIDAVGEGAVVSIQAPVQLSGRSEPQPDIAILRPRKDRYASSHPTAADVILVIEVSDTTLQFDRDTKAKLYARHGVPELWIVDLNSRQMNILRAPRRGEYQESSTAAAGLMRLPTLAVDVDLRDLLTPL
jgi:Uma2 family endonuclease